MDMNVRLNTAYAHSGSASKANTDSSETQLSKDVTSPKSEKTKPDGETLEQAVKSIQEFVDSVQRNLEFSIDDSTGAVVVKVIAKASGELIRQLPSEEALKLAQSLKSENPALIQDKV
ncbi:MULTISPECIES: flagellar protein FlaG [Pseudomonas]|uniref:Flagellar protein FlaG n=1 Tax=Pseudomonas lutea TaxID=243924 RepID=A0A9X8MCE2_9PSED|nr:MULTISPECIES: flagellar protein FlaG [Pseudomonas]MCG7371259.1 flagellar protein FlaG [Pseudomonas luteola]SEQ48202.1 flagellar protein FlaG [Pseudomonas lutea]